MWIPMIDTDKLKDGDIVEYEAWEESGEKISYKYRVRKTADHGDPYIYNMVGERIPLNAFTRSGNYMEMSGDRKGQVIGVIKRMVSRQ